MLLMKKIGLSSLAQILLRNQKCNITSWKYSNSVQVKQYAICVANLVHLHAKCISHHETSRHRRHILNVQEIKDTIQARQCTNISDSSNSPTSHNIHNALSVSHNNTSVVPSRKHEEGMFPYAVSEPPPRTLVINVEIELTEYTVCAEIFQLGAKCKTSSFSAPNIIPEAKLDEWVIEDLGIVLRKWAMGTPHEEMRLFDEHTRSFIEGSVDGKRALCDFIAWMQDLKQTGEYSDVVLISMSDVCLPALINNIARYRLMDDFIATVDLCTNTPAYFRYYFLPHLTKHRNVFPEANR